MTPRRVAIACALLVAGCFGDKVFHCGTDDTRCNASMGERCIADRCATHDTSCSTGFRYTGSAGDVAGQCIAVPDGGLTCSAVNDPCDDNDPCTVNDTCTQMGSGLTCVGTPKDCGPPTCTGGMQATPTCVAGQCQTMMTACAPYACAGTTCSTHCVSLADCTSGAYCTSGKCLSCADWTSNPSYVPTFATPTALAGVNSTGDVDDSGSVTPDGALLALASTRAGGLGGYDLYTATASAGAWSTPMPVTALNSSSNEMDLTTSDGATFYFASDRDCDWDLFSVARDMSGAFGAPTPLSGAAVNQMGTREAHPSLVLSGLTLFFESDRSSAATVDKWLQVFSATRTDTTMDFSGPVALTGLELDTSGASPVTASWASPSATADGKGLFLANASLPTHTEIGVVHLDGNGSVVGNASILTGIDLGGGADVPGNIGRVSVSADGCMLLVTDRNIDPAGDVYVAPRSGLVFCQNAGCGTDDNCCPTGCTGLHDRDCPYPRTLQVIEYYSASSQSHDYRLRGEPPLVADAMPTNNNFRIFADPVPTAVPFYRYTSATCTYMSTDTTGPSGYTQAQIGYVLQSPLRQSARMYRARSTTGCDVQLSLNATYCQMLGSMGYICDSPSGSGTGQLPFNVFAAEP